MQRRRYKGSSREGRGESRPRLESRVVGSTRGSAACTLSVLLARSVHIESKSRRTIKADVSIWTCRDFLFFLLFSAFILPLPLFLWFHSPLPYSSLSFLFFFFFTFPWSVLPSQDILGTFLARSSLHTSPPSLVSRVYSTLPSGNWRLQFYSFTTLAPW